MQHLACIMDGNRRFAKKNGLKPWLGHTKGVDAVRTTIEFCVQHNIPYLSLYAFSLENLHRSDEEKQHLFALMVDRIEKHSNEFSEKNIRIRFIGDRMRFPEQVLKSCSEIEDKTASGTRLQVDVLFCYGGRQEIVAAARQAAQAVLQGTMRVEDITDESFSAQLWQGDIPAPDLIIRTGGVCRLSNFLLYQAAYAELYFSDLLWPEITTEHLQAAVDTFNQRKRTFGS